ncbi:phage tail protein [Paraburkholderia phytofirmans]|jgi:phage tail-like protein|uniref:Phage tail protein n=1 Tax=Paraburkholderia phytofirmans OLGA172 TaxID=1417228 RepID=A0A161I6B6_9BURK|nr:phage tail protein [Paraburkholderia phytofirmans]ANB72003.1 phage tail protein [Paraburkholderia phytofirmans OLGA172]
MNSPAFFQPATSHRFSVTFWLDRMPVPSVVDSSFQRIAGLSREWNVSAYSEGGENLRNRYFAEKIQHGSLTLERGVMALTPLSIMVNAQLLTGKVMYLDAVITLFDVDTLPLCNWLITKALPVRWHTSNLDATSSRVLINTLELRYQEMIPMGVKL